MPVAVRLWFWVMAGVPTVGAPVSMPVAVRLSVPGPARAGVPTVGAPVSMPVAVRAWTWVIAGVPTVGAPVAMPVAVRSLTAVEKMESLMGRMRLHDAAKAGRMREMFAEAVDVDALLSTAFDL